MSKISEMTAVETVDGSEFIPVLKDGENQRLEIIKLVDDIVVNREDFIDGPYTSPTVFSNIYDVTDIVGGVEEASDIDLYNEPSTIRIRHNIIENPASGWKKTLISGHKVFVPRELNDFHLFETRIKTTCAGENPAGTIFLGFSSITTASSLLTTHPFVGMYVSIISTDGTGGDIPYNQLTVVANVVNDTPTTLLTQVLTTPTTCWVEQAPLVDAQYTKFGVKLFKDKAEFYINDVLSYTYTFTGALFSSTSQALYSSFGAYSYGEDFYGGGELDYWVDYLSVKSKISR